MRRAAEGRRSRPKSGNRPQQPCAGFQSTSEICAAIPHIAEAAADVPFSLWDSCMESLLVQITFPPYDDDSLYKMNL